MKRIHLGLAVASVVMALGLRAEATAPAVVYTLNGPTANVTYSSANGGSLTYGVQTFHGSDIRVVSTDAGQLVSVSTVLTVDSGSTTLSVLIPSGVVSAAPTPISTFAVVTIHKYSVVPAFNVGQLELQTIVPLTGTAVAQ